jgi:hypothetical protein
MSFRREKPMTTRFTSDDEGKKVVNADGDGIGMITEVRGDTAYVDPDPGITDSVMSKLGWGDSDEETYALRDDHVETVTDDEVRLARTL